MATLYGWCLSGELQRVIDYAINPQKTDGKTLVAYKNHSGILPEAMDWNGNCKENWPERQTLR